MRNFAEFACAMCFLHKPESIMCRNVFFSFFFDKVNSQAAQRRGYAVFLQIWVELNDHPFCVNWVLTITFLQGGSKNPQGNPLTMPIYSNPSPESALKRGSDQKLFKYGDVINPWNQNLMLILKNPMANTLKMIILSVISL